MANIKKTELELRLYQEKDWENVKKFLHNNWRKNHPICRKYLFDWQHRGFGYKHGDVNSLVLMHNDEVVGFRGIIPGLYQVPLRKNKMAIIRGASSPMWMVKNDFRGISSLKMYYKTLKMFPVLSAAGINVKTSMKLHRKNNYMVLDSINRYIIPLNENGFQQLLFDDCDIENIKEWVKKIKINNAFTPPSTPEIDKIAALWKKISFSQQIFSLYRNADFWKWRYLDSKGFQYLFFGDPEYNGVVVGRIEKIFHDGSEKFNNKNVFRIIEILPCSVNADNEVPQKFVEMIFGVLNWAIEEECLMADFQCSSTRFEKILYAIGFKKQNLYLNKAIGSVPSLFQPLRYDYPPINVAFRIDLPDIKFKEFGWDDTYLVKSESDQDRPNI